MSVGTIRELIVKEHLSPALLSHFIDLDSGKLTLTFECEYWDYKRELPDLDDPLRLAELAADILAFHNTRGGYIIFGITDDHIVLGLHEHDPKAIQSATLNAKLRKYTSERFCCRYACFDLAIGGAHKCLSVIFIPPRRGDPVRAASDAPGHPPLFRQGEIFIRAGDTRKRPVSNADLLFISSYPEPDLTIGSHQLTATYPRPGFRIFVGDYIQKTGFIGSNTRIPLIKSTIDRLLYDKYDVLVLRGEGGIGKTALATEITALMESDPEYRDLVGGLISLSAKSQILSPFELSSLKPEVGTYDEFLTQVLVNTVWNGDLPQETAAKESLVSRLLRDNNIVLFIDNFETIDEEGARIPQFIRRLPAGVKVLITSRHRPITIPADEVRLKPLDVEEGRLLAIAEAQVQRLGADVVEPLLSDIVKMSEGLPLAIKWIIGCSKNASHLRQLIEEYNHGKPTLDNLCEFCFTFEYRLLSSIAKTALTLFPMFTRAHPTARELAVAAEVDVDAMVAALRELSSFSLVTPTFSTARGEEVYSALRLTTKFAAEKLTDFPDLERRARRRLKDFYGASIPVSVAAAKEMVSRGVTAAARQYLDEEVLDRDPKNAMAHYLKGQTYENEGLDTLAQSEYEAALSNAGGDNEVVTEASLRMSAARRRDPQISREQTIPLLKKAYQKTADNRIARELAREYEIMGNPKASVRYYSAVYNHFVTEQQEIWEEAAVFLLQRKEEEEGAKSALSFVKNAETICPASQILQRWDRALDKKVIDEAGHVKWTHKTAHSTRRS